MEHKEILFLQKKKHNFDVFVGVEHSLKGKMRIGNEISWRVKVSQSRRMRAATGMWKMRNASEEESGLQSKKQWPRWLTQEVQSGKSP